MAFVLNTSQSGSSGGKSKPKKRVHSKSYRNLQSSKRRAYDRLKKYAKKHGLAKKEFSSSKRAARKKKLAKVAGIGAGVVAVVVLVGLIITGAWLGQVSASLPQPGELVNRKIDESTKIYSKDGKLLYTFYGDENREYVDIEKVPEHTKWAVLAAEDVEFYEHEGVDLPGIVSSFLSYVLKRSTRVRGASTITQQLVKNTLLYDIMGDAAFERTYSRKIKEILITLQLEKTLSKEEILEMYMNEVNLGGVNYGFQAASKAYFGKDVSELTLAESAMLAGIIQRPSAYSPLYGTNPEMSEERKEIVLNLIEKYKDKAKISQKEIDEARKEELKYQAMKTDIKAPHFVFYVRDELIDEFGEDLVYRGGLKVTTSLDMEIQKIAEEEVRNMVDKNRTRHNTHNGGMVAINPKTGEIVAMVGSYDYWETDDERVDGNVNITTALRQPGSAIKPVNYLGAFENGTVNPATPLYNISGIDFGYDLKNWDGQYRGLQSARDALTNSENIPAVEVIMINGGVDPFIETAEKLGITTFTQRERYGNNITLGAAEVKLVEHTGAYAIYANGGKKMPTTSILKVERPKAKEVLYEYNPEEVGEQVVSEQAVYLLNDVLAELTQSRRRYFPQNYRVGDQKLGGKTGTTNSHRDASAYLYYPRLAVGFWSGNNNNEEQIGTAGAGWSTTVPLPAVNSFMTRVIPIFGKESFKRPSGIVTKTVCRKSGLLATEACSGDTMTEVFINGKTPDSDKAYSVVKVCTNENKVSTNVDIASKFSLIKDVKVVRLTAHKKSWQPALDKWLSGQGLFGPSGEGPCSLPLGDGETPLVDITNPSSGATFNAGDAVTVSANISTLNGLSKVVIKFDSTTVKDENTSSGSYSTSITIPASASNGAHTITVTATDVDGKVGSASVGINIGSIGVNVSMTKPSSGSTQSLPVTLEATLSGDVAAVTGVTFYVKNNGGIVVYTGSGVKSGSKWSVTWNGPAGGGTYSTYCIVTHPSGSVTSSSVPFSLS